MRKAKLFFIFYLALFAKQGLAQQDPQYSQYMFNPLVLNPAYAGSREVINTALLYRNQWVGLQGAPVTITASINSPLKSKRVGIGLHVISDKIGPSSMTQYVGSYAYRIRFAKGKLAFGLRAGLYDYRYDWSKVDYKDQADVFNAQNKSHFIRPSFDFGMYYYSSSFYAGAAVSHIAFKASDATTTNVDYDKQFVPHLVGSIGKAFEINKRITLRPSAVLRYTQNAPVNVDLNASVLLDEKLWLGLGFRSNKELIFTMEYALNKAMRMGYSYDWGTQTLNLTNKGTHEFFIGIDIDFFKSKTISPRIFKYN